MSSVETKTHESNQSLEEFNLAKRKMNIGIAIFIASAVMILTSLALVLQMQG